jgi:hypothetical protein
MAPSVQGRHRDSVLVELAVACYYTPACMTPLRIVPSVNYFMALSVSIVAGIVCDRVNPPTNTITLMQLSTEYIDLLSYIDL